MGRGRIGYRRESDEHAWRRWGRWRFAALIPSGYRLTPVHKDTGVHASSIPTSARLIFHMEIQQA